MLEYFIVVSKRNCGTYYLIRDPSDHGGCMWSRNKQEAYKFSSHGSINKRIAPYKTHDIPMKIVYINEQRIVDETMNMLARI